MMKENKMELVAFIKVNEEKVIRNFSVRPQDDKDCFVPVGWYPVIVEKCHIYNKPVYKAVYVDTEKQTHKMEIYNEQYSEMVESGEIFEA